MAGKRSSTSSIAASSSVKKAVESSEGSASPGIGIEVCSTNVTVRMVEADEPSTSRQSVDDEHADSAKLENTRNAIRDETEQLRQLREENAKLERQILAFRQGHLDRIAEPFTPHADGRSSRGEHANDGRAHDEGVAPNDDDDVIVAPRENGVPNDVSIVSSRNPPSYESVAHANNRPDTIALRLRLEKTRAENSAVNMGMNMERRVNDELVAEYKAVQADHQRTLVQQHAQLIHVNNQMFALQQSILRLQDSGLVDGTANGVQNGGTSIGSPFSQSGHVSTKSA